MTIFYTAAFHGKQTYQKQYDMVLKAIKQTGAKIISPEIGNYLDVLNTAQKKNLKDERLLHYEAIRKGILLADGVIIEASFESFQLGAEAAFALENSKHLLCLSVNENFSDKMKRRYLRGAQYNEHNIEEIVEEFVKMVEMEHFSERFNCFLSPIQIAHIKRKAKLRKMNTSEYVRQLIDDDRGI